MLCRRALLLMMTAAVRATASHINLSVVGGGADNTASGDASTVAGGLGNLAAGNEAAVGGAWNNSTTGDDATIAGCLLNQATGEATPVGYTLGSGTTRVERSQSGGSQDGWELSDVHHTAPFNRW